MAEREDPGYRVRMSRGSVKGRLFLSVIGLALALVGAVFLWLMWRSFARARAMDEWPQVEAVVLSSEVGERRIGESAPTEFRFEVLFGYEWEGERLTSERLSLRGRLKAMFNSFSNWVVKRFLSGTSEKLPNKKTW